MVRAGQSGIVYNFLCMAENIVMDHLLDEIPKNQNYRVFFDNWFSTLPLLIKLHSMGILSAATLRSNRVVGCPLMSDKGLEVT